MVNKVFLKGLKIILVNPATGREWKETLDAQGLLLSMDSTMCADGVNVAIGRVTVKAGITPVVVGYKVAHSYIYAGKLSTTTEVLTLDGAEYPTDPCDWVVKLVPILDILPDPDSRSC